MEHIKEYIYLLIIGYFGVKILYGLFGKYPKKPMKDEMTDFSIMMVMAAILFLITSMNITSPLFFAGYLVGLNFAFVYQYFTTVNYLSMVIFIIFLFVLLFFNIINISDTTSYLLYIVMIIFLILGLIMTRKPSHIYQSMKYDKNLQDIFNQLTVYFDSDTLSKMIDDDDFRDAVKTRNINRLTKITTQYFPSFPQMQDKNHIIDLLLSFNGTIMENGWVNDGGTFINFNVAIIGWLLSLLFVNTSNVKELTLFNGFTLGMFVAGVSFFGFPYIISDKKGDECFGEDECAKKGLILKNKEYDDISSSVKTLKWGLAINIMSVMALVVLFYTIKN